jgi:hypothetical protein
MYADTAIHRAERACLNGDSKTARRWLDSFRDDSSATSTARINRVLNALETWISRLDGLEVNVDATVACLTSHHRVGREAADIGDIEVYVAMDVLVSARRQAEARALLNRYVMEYRRSRCPLARPLQEIAFTVDWDGDPTFTPATLTRRAQRRSAETLAVFAATPA